MIALNIEEAKQPNRVRRWVHCHLTKIAAEPFPIFQKLFSPMLGVLTYLCLCNGLVDVVALLSDGHHLAHGSPLLLDRPLLVLQAAQAALLLQLLRLKINGEEGDLIKGARKEGAHIKGACVNFEFYEVFHLIKRLQLLSLKLGSMKCFKGILLDFKKTAWHL